MNSEEMPGAIPPAEIAAPVIEPERVVEIDVLRGVALLGILLLNIKGFSMPDQAYFNPYAYGDMTGANFWVWWATHVFGDMKFMGIFSMLFGAGIVLMTQRAESRTGHSAGLHYSRMAWLLAIGVVHSYLIWHGDILVLYVQCGLLIYLFRKLPWWALTAMGLALLAIGSLLSLFFGITMPSWPPDAVTDMKLESWMPDAQGLEHALSTYRGGLLEQLPDRASMSLGWQTFGFIVFGFWRAAGMMLLGMALFKTRILTGQRSGGFYAGMAILGLLLGLPMIVAGIAYNDRHDWAITHGFFQGMQFNWWGSVFVSLAYIGIVMLVCRAAVLNWLTASLAAVGRMALTNYLMHSVLCTLFFYGHGLGQYGKLERTEQMMVVGVVWIVQLIVSPIWLRSFRFGPMEWLWRSLTYWKMQPMRRV